MSYRLTDLVQQLGHPKLLVLGDLILDRYVWGDAERISQEAPVILLQQDRQEVRLGGAANVANMLRGLESDVTMAGVVGDDEDGRQLGEVLKSAGVDCSAVIVDATRPTTVKERFIGRAQHRHPHQMLRVDRESREPLSSAMSAQLLQSVQSLLAGHQALLISDYSKGVCTPQVLRCVIEAAGKAHIPVIIDPGSAADYANYAGATAMTPNRLEAQRAAGREIAGSDDAFAAGRLLCRKYCLDHVFVTLDSDGIALVRCDGSAELLPTRKRQVYDITGAGDMVLATIGVGTAAGIGPEALARLANVAGGLEVEQIGVVTVSRRQILDDLVRNSLVTKEKVCNLDELEQRVQSQRGLGQKIVFTNGCFDLLHPGHVHYLQQAAALGDRLVVAVNSDDGVRRHKGPQRPLIGERERTLMLAALECVDDVIVFNEDTPSALLQRLQPDLLVKGGTTTEIVGRDIVEAYGGEVVTLDALTGFSTTSLVNRIRRDAA